jgi:penicillin amidase
LKNTFEDELGAENFKMFLGTHLIKQLVARQIKNEKSLWWDNANTKDVKESRGQIVIKSFKESIVALKEQLGSDVEKWTWNKVHTVEHQHPLGKVAVLRRVLNVGPFEVSGATEVINNLFFDFSADGNYDVKGGPSTRRIIDFSDVENSWSILPTGQSGNPLSAHYNDQAELYNAGKYRRMLLNKAEIIRTSTKLVFLPKKKK